MKLLESVGTFIDENGVTYPANADNTPDLESPFDLDDIDNSDWWDGLSAEDLECVNEYM
jgi:hypothetical protein